jgi:shikimate kinase/3-dehydroquinate synthase
MHIFLYGPSGSGKSTVGKLLALSINRPFLDLDSAIEAQTGRTVQEFISEQGEREFRDAETSTLQKVITRVDTVIALGGGALLRKENASLAEETGKVVLLDADFSTLARRLSKGENTRPLLGVDIEADLAVLLERRRAHYASFALRVNASPQPGQVVWDIQRLLGLYHVRGMGQGYDVFVRENSLDHFGEILKGHELSGPVLVVSDTNVAPLYAGRMLTTLKRAGIVASSLVIPAGEENKTLETVSAIWRGCLEAGLDRKSTIVALGGGMVGDLSGFAAATFMRGVPWVNAPTSLLAMVDASVGGKTGFDLPEGKNLIGSFYPPRFVLADPDTLHTLPESELRSGMAEVVKHGVIADPDLFSFCSYGMEKVKGNLGYIVRRAIAVKIDIIQKDPFEHGIRAALNLGHTVGHAVELVSNFKIRHGDAVAIGMVVEARLAERLALAGAGLSGLLLETLSKLGLPVELPGNLPRADLIRAMKVDKKKAAGIVRFALPVKIGEVKVGVEIEDLEEVL